MRTVSPTQQVSFARHTWLRARGLPASWEADAVFVEDVDDEGDVTEHADKRGQGGDVMEEAGRHPSGWTTLRNRQTRQSTPDAPPSSVFFLLFCLLTVNPPLLQVSPSLLKSPSLPTPSPTPFSGP